MRKIITKKQISKCRAGGRAQTNSHCIGLIHSLHIIIVNSRRFHVLQITTGKAATILSQTQTHCQCITSNCLYHIAVFKYRLFYPIASDTCQEFFR